MADITMCRNEKCPLRKDCYRYLAKVDKYQSYGNFEYKDGFCEFYYQVGYEMPINRELYKKLNKQP